jgi:hypothetical protein
MAVALTLASDNFNAASQSEQKSNVRNKLHNAPIGIGTPLAPRDAPRGQMRQRLSAD